MSAQPSRTLPARPLLLGTATLTVLLVAALLVPRGGEPDEGGLAPVTDARGAISDRDRAEIERVLAEAPRDVRARTTPSALAAGLLRCAEFEGQRYCLGTGWTSATEGEVVARAADESTTRARGTGRETTGDLATADLLEQRAAMTPEELEATERTELEEAARDVEKVVTLRHEILGEPLPDGFAARYPAAARTAATAAKGFGDYPQRDTVMDPRHVRAQTRTYWCGPATMQMIAWGWQGERRLQKHWATRLGTTTSGSSISEMVRVTNKATGYDRSDRAGKYVVLDISDWGFKDWMLLQMRHVHDYRAPLILHPVLVQRFYPYLDDDASGHFQVGRGYDKNGRKPGLVGYFEPWNQQRFDPSEPYISRVQWRRAYNSFRANKAHPHQNIGV